jgi:hypothetical protein
MPQRSMDCPTLNAWLTDDSDATLWCHDIPSCRQARRIDQAETMASTGQITMRSTRMFAFGLRACTSHSQTA